MNNDAAKKTAYYGFTGAIEPASATRIASAFNHAVNNGYDEIYLCFSSTGGYIADGVFLYNHIKGLPAKVVVHNTGTVMSIATAVYVAAESRYCSRHGIFMLHPTAMPAQERMHAEQLQSSLTAALADDQRTEDILRERTSIPDTLLSERRFKEVHITSEEALKFGLANRIVEFALPRGQEVMQI